MIWKFKHLIENKFMNFRKHVRFFLLTNVLRSEENYKGY